MGRKIVVAYDGSDLSKKALAEAKLQAVGKLDAEVHVISIISQAGPSTNITVARGIQEELAESIRPDLQGIKETFEAEDIAVVTDIIIDYTQNNPAMKICNYAEEHDADLIIAGSRGLGSVRKFLLGSVSNSIVQHAELPILIIK